MPSKFRIQDGIIFPDGTEQTTAGLQGVQGIQGLTGPVGQGVPIVSAANLALNTALSMDNVSVQIRSQSAGVWMFVNTVSGTANWAWSITYQLGLGTTANTQGMIGTWSATTTPTTIGSNSYYFNYAAGLLTTIITDITAGKMYRVTWQTTTGSSPYGNFVSIEKLV